LRLFRFFNKKILKTYTTHFYSPVLNMYTLITKYFMCYLQLARHHSLCNLTRKVITYLSSCLLSHIHHREFSRLYRTEKVVANYHAVLSAGSGNSNPAPTGWLARLQSPFFISSLPPSLSFVCRPAARGAVFVVSSLSERVDNTTWH